jgi:hypothetical protein
LALNDHPENRRQLVQTLCEVLLNDPNSIMRLKAVESLRLIRAEEAINELCCVFKTDPDLNVRLAAADAAVEIENPEAFKTMSETPKYDFRGAKIGSIADNVQGDQVSYQFNLAEANLDEELTEIQQILNTLQQKHSQASESEASAIIEAEFREIKQRKPWQWENLLNLKRLRKGSKTAALKVGEHFSEENVWGKAFLGFLEGISDEE